MNNIRKAKEGYFLMKGTVINVLRDCNFEVKLENGSVIAAFPSGKMRKNNIRIIQNDKVDVEISIYDLTKGRIVYRYK